MKKAIKVYLIALSTVFGACLVLFAFFASLYELINFLSLHGIRGVGAAVLIWLVSWGSLFVSLVIWDKVE